MMKLIEINNAWSTNYYWINISNIQIINGLIYDYLANYSGNNSCFVIDYNANLLFSSKKEAQKEAEAIERMQIREYGKKINDETRNKHK